MMQGLTYDFPKTSKNTPIKVYSDASRRNGICSCGWTFHDHNDGFLTMHGQDLGKMEVHVAETEGMERVLNYLEHHTPVDHVKLYGDSKDALRNIWRQEFGFDYFTAEWIPREENELADMAALKFSGHL